MSTTSSASAPADDHRNRILEVIAVVLLGVATVGSAWCAYQATRWNGEESQLSRTALDTRVEASRLFGLATQVVSYDSSSVAQYAQAAAEDNQLLMDFYRQSLIRPEFIPTLNAWEAQIRSGGGAPTNLLEDEAYLNAQLADYRAAEVEANVQTIAAEAANDRADEYVLLTLVLASALFFAGVTTSFRFRFARLVLLAGSIVLIAYAASRVADLPVA